MRLRSSVKGSEYVSFARRGCCGEACLGCIVALAVPVARSREELPMRRAEWYVIQVETGRERAACDAIVRACERAEYSRDLGVDGQRSHLLLRECFAPLYRSRYKLHGQWHDEERLLLPGYVVAVTADPWELARVLRGVSGLTRLLTMGETFSPLSDDDRSWVERWTKEGDRTIPMSVAHKVCMQAGGRFSVSRAAGIQHRWLAPSTRSLRDAPYSSCMPPQVRESRCIASPAWSRSRARSCSGKGCARCGGCVLRSS